MMQLTGKRLLTPYAIAGVVLVLGLTGCFRNAVDEASRQQGGNGSVIDSECVRPDYLAALDAEIKLGFQRDLSPRDDQDGDRVHDYWEEIHGLNPEDPGDSELDPDGDGYTNLEEYRNLSDPRSARSNPGRMQIWEVGFDCFYTAEMGLINDDNLLDVLIRDPSEGYMPAVRDFVMIQQADHGFVIEDALDYEIPELTSIQSALRLVELSMDSSMDIALIGLAEFIPEANDQMIFGHTSPNAPIIGFHLDVIPYRHKELDLETRTFFRELYNWIRNGDYFENNAPLLATVPEVLNLAWLRDESGNVPRDLQPVSRGMLSAGCEADLVYCFDVTADAGDPERFSANEIIAVNYRETPFRVRLHDTDNDPDEPDLNFLVQATFSENPDRQVKDYSVFNQDALRLARNELRVVRNSGVLLYPSDEASAISAAFMKYLGFSAVYGMHHRVGDWGGWPYKIELTREDISLADGTINYIRLVQDFIADRYMTRPSHLYEQ